MRRKIGIVDYGVGNVSSVANAIQRIGHRVVIGGKASDFTGTAAIILPGVGSFPFAMKVVREGGLDRFLAACYEQQDIKIIGICLGMQLMFEFSEEGAEEGLGILQGRVNALPNKQCHVGWNHVHPPSWDNPHGRQEAFYFNHSYYVECDRELVRQTADYVLELPAVVRSGQFYGTQFHP